MIEKNMVNAFFFSLFFHFARTEGKRDGRGCQAEQPDGLVFEGENGGVDT